MIILNGNEEDVERMRVKMEGRVAARKSSKKEKKATKQEVNTDEPSSSKSSTATSKDTSKPSTSGSSSSAAPSSSSSSKLVPTAEVKALKRGKLDKLGDPEFKKAKEDYSVAEDPKVSAVYKSLFTTHESEQKQDRAHWVTYNPHYN